MFVVKMIYGWVPAIVVVKGKKVTCKRAKRVTVIGTTRLLTEPRVETQTQQEKVELGKTRSWTRIENYSTERESEGLLDTKEAPTLSCHWCRAVCERETTTATGRPLKHD